MNEETNQRIKDFKIVLETGLHFDLITQLLKSTNYGGVHKMGEYVNTLTITDWLVLYEKIGIEVSYNQIEILFEYMKKYYKKFFFKINGNIYAVSKAFQDFEKNYKNFEFEYIVYYSINL